MNRRSRRDFVLGAAGTLSGAGACQERSKPVNPTPAAPESSRPASLSQRVLGRTGVQVSMLGLGGFHIADKLGEKESIELVRTAIDGGITFLDNCWDYHAGASEDRMGKALGNGYRERAFLMTKVDGRTKRAAELQLEQSLQRLRTDVIDLVQIHEVIYPTDPERCFAEGGAIEALTAARKAGKLRFIGFTGHKDPSLHLAMLQAATQHDFEFDTVQMPLNVLDAHYKSFERDVLPVLLARNIGVLGMKSMGSGDILKSGVVTPAECLRYALSLPTSVVISGMDGMKTLQHNLRLARDFRPLDAAERTQLLSRTAPAAKDGQYEAFKTSPKFDGTARNPHWLEEARL